MCRFVCICIVAALALFGQCCYQQGEYRRAIQYTKTALSELTKLRRTPQHALPIGIQACLASPELEWTLQLIDAHAAVRDEAQAQKLLEQLYTATLASHPVASSTSAAPLLPIKYLLQLARLYSTPPTASSSSVPQSATTFNIRAAVAIHSSIIALHPLALESALELIRLGTDPRPIVGEAWAAHAAAATGTTTAQQSALQHQSLLLYLFLTAHWNAAQRHYIESLSSPDAGGFNFLVSLAPRSTHLLESKAWSQFQCMDSDHVMRTLSHLHNLDPYVLNGMDLLSMIYYQKNLTKELSILMAHCMRIDETKPQSWLVASFHASIQNQKDKSLKYIEKALLLASSLVIDFTQPMPPVHTQSMPYIIRGYHFLEIETENYQQALQANTEALERGDVGSVITIVASQNFEQALSAFRKAQIIDSNHNGLIIQGLMKCYVLHAQIAMTQPQNANLSNGASSSLAQHPSFKTAVGLLSSEVNLASNKLNPQPRVQFGILLSMVPEGRQKSAKILHQALQLDSDYNEAIMALTEMYCASKQYSDAINMLLPYIRKAATAGGGGGANSAVSSASSSSLPIPIGHRDYFLVKLANLYILQGDLINGLKYYKEALIINPTCRTAIEGIQKMDQQAKG